MVHFYFDVSFRVEVRFGVGDRGRVKDNMYQMYKNFRVEICRKVVDHSVRGPFCPGT